MPKTTEPDHLGPKIEIAIAEKGVSQKAVAAAFKVKPPSVNGWISKGSFSKWRMPQFVRYFERPYEWWFDDGATTTNGAARTFAKGLSTRMRAAMKRRGYERPDKTLNVLDAAKNAGCSPSTIMMPDCIPEKPI